MACQRPFPKPRGGAICSTSMPPARSSPRSIWRRRAIIERGYDIMLIGHEGHPEVIGTMGQLPDGAITLIESVADAEAFMPRDPSKARLSSPRPRCRSTTPANRRRPANDAFPTIAGPRKEDICYATTNRQEAVKQIAPDVRCASRRRGAEQLQLAAPGRGRPSAAAAAARYWCRRAEDIDWPMLGNPRRIGITAGASAPEVLIDEVIEAFKPRFDVTIETSRTRDENVSFKLPRELRRENPPRRGREPSAVTSERRRPHLHRRRLFGQSRARRLGRRPALRRPSRRSCRAARR